jgi:hypothetical protein
MRKPKFTSPSLVTGYVRLATPIALLATVATACDESNGPLITQPAERSAQEPSADASPPSPCPPPIGLGMILRVHIE